MWLEMATRLHPTSDVKARAVCREELREGSVGHPYRRTFNQRASSSGDSLMREINKYSTTSWVSENPPQALSQSSLATRLTALVTNHKMPSRLSSSSFSATSNSLHPHCDRPRRTSWHLHNRYRSLGVTWFKMRWSTAEAITGNSGARRA